MKQILMGLVLALSASLAQAVSPVGQQYIERMVNGGPSTVRGVAKSLYETGNREQEVLDVLAERVLGYYSSMDRTTADAAAWGCRALGASGNARYRAVLEEVSRNAANKKLRGHADKALGSLPKGGSDKPYQKGMVDLDKQRNVAASKAQAAPKAQAAAAAQSAAARSGSGAGFADVQHGMTTDEVRALLGSPTSDSSRITGKQFRPFNYRGSDTVRITYYYKGMGRIVFSNSSHYTSIFRVLEVQPDASESGYP